MRSRKVERGIEGRGNKQTGGVYVGGMYNIPVYMYMYIPASV